MTPKIRARPGWALHSPGDTPLCREPVRPSLLRFYAARTDPTRTRGARRASKGLRQARQLKAGAAA